MTTNVWRTCSHSEVTHTDTHYTRICTCTYTHTYMHTQKCMLIRLSSLAGWHWLLLCINCSLTTLRRSQPQKSERDTPTNSLFFSFDAQLVARCRHDVGDQKLEYDTKSTMTRQRQLWLDPMLTNFIIIPLEHWKLSKKGILTLCKWTYVC